jgi:hypothetical protein
VFVLASDLDWLSADPALDSLGAALRRQAMLALRFALAL